MIKQFAKWSWLFALTLVFGTIACEKDATDAVTDTVLGVDDYLDYRDGGDGINNLCFEIVFPVTVEYPNGTAETVTSVEGLSGLFFTWQQNNPQSHDRPTIVMPFTVILEDGAEDSIESKADLRALLDECMPHLGGGGPGNGGPHGNGGPNGNGNGGPGDGGPHGNGGPGNGPGDGNFAPCFEFVFPLTIVYPDDAGTAVANDRDEMKELLMAWHQANPGAEARPTIQMPFDVVLTETNETQTITTEEDFAALRESCGGFGPGGPGDGPHGNGPHDGGPFGTCFEFVFPITVVYPDGSGTAEAADADALKALMQAWHESHEMGDGRLEFSYPFSVTILDDNSEQVIDDLDEFRELMRSCRP